MKKRVMEKINWARGHGSSCSSPCSDEGSHSRQADAEVHHSLVPYAPPARVMEPECGLILSPEELQKYHTLCNIAYASTNIIDPNLLDRIAITSEFKTIFYTIGGGVFWMIHELGNELLTHEFLCTLKTSQNGVTF